MSLHPHNSTESPTKSKAAKLKAFPFSDRLLPCDFVPTKEEQCLLDTYSAIRLFEKEAAKFREAQAKAKLTAADERYRSEKEKKEHPSIDNTTDRITTEAPKKQSKKRKDARPEKKENESSSETEEDRVFVTAEKKSIEKASVEEIATEEAMRGELLGEASLLKTDNMAPLIKKKPKKEGPDLSTMLLSSVEPMATPPYDFSKSLGMTKDGLDGTCFQWRICFFLFGSQVLFFFGNCSRTKLYTCFRLIPFSVLQYT